MTVFSGLMIIRIVYSVKNLATCWGLIQVLKTWLNFVDYKPCKSVTYYIVTDQKCVFCMVYTYIMFQSHINLAQLSPESRYRILWNFVPRPDHDIPWIPGHVEVTVPYKIRIFDLSLCNVLRIYTVCCLQNLIWIRQNSW